MAHEELEFDGVVIPDEVAIITDRRVDYTIVPPEGVGTLELPIVAADGRAPEDVFASDESDEDDADDSDDEVVVDPEPQPEPGREAEDKDDIVVESDEDDK